MANTAIQDCKGSVMSINAVLSPVTVTRAKVDEPIVTAVMPNRAPRFG